MHPLAVIAMQESERWLSETLDDIGPGAAVRRGSTLSAPAASGSPRAPRRAAAAMLHHIASALTNLALRLEPRKRATASDGDA
jgi:hypothetical protein